MGETARDGIKKEWVSREENDEITTHVDASNLAMNDRSVVSAIDPYGCGSMNNSLVHYKRNLQQIEAVSSPAVHQTPEPSLLFPSTITAFLTGSRADGSDRQLRVARGSGEVEREYAPKYG